MSKSFHKKATGVYKLGVIAAAVVIIAIIWMATVRLRPSAPFPADGKLHVVAAENFWGDIAAQVGGRHVDVVSIITDPSADPHLFESDARTAAAAADAAVVVQNGLGYDDFMDRLVATNPVGQRQVLTAADILDVHGQDANPHLWYDLSRSAEVAAAIATVLEARDPAHTSDYRVNLAHFQASLQPAEAAIKQLQANYHGAPVAYTERVPGYLLAEAGLGVQTLSGFAAAIENGNEPSPADNQEMEQLITGRRIRALIYNSQVTSPITQHLRDLAEQNGVPVVGMSETMPAGASYQSWQLQQITALREALGG